MEGHVKNADQTKKGKKRRVRANVRRDRVGRSLLGEKKKRKRNKREIR